MSPSEALCEAVLLLTTTGDDESARALSLALVEEGLAACVTRTVVQSVYRWEPAGEAPGSGGTGRVCEDAEVLLIVKTSRSRAAQTEARILALHSYECPEVVRIAPEHVEPRYLAWLLAACR